MNKTVGYTGNLTYKQTHQAISHLNQRKGVLRFLRPSPVGDPCWPSVHCVRVIAVGFAHHTSGWGARSLFIVPNPPPRLKPGQVKGRPTEHGFTILCYCSLASFTATCSSSISRIFPETRKTSQQASPWRGRCSAHPRQYRSRSTWLPFPHLAPQTCDSKISRTLQRSDAQLQQTPCGRFFFFSTRN